jgi:gamma-glutamylputrescine oxidase
VPTRSYWLDRPLGPIPVRPGSGPVEVVVVGGGVSGCACALSLAKGGLRVRLIDAGRVAGGASGRNGGFALRGGAARYDEARAALGADAARMLWALSEEALERVERLAGAWFRRVGSVRLAADAAELDALGRECDALGADGLAAGQPVRLSPPLDRLYAGGFLQPLDGALDPARFVRGLAARAAQAGVEIGEHRPLEAAALDHLDADAVVVAVDGSTATLLPELAPYVLATRGQVLVTEPLAGRLFPRPHYARGGYDYWQQLPDRRLLLGGRRDRSPETERTDADATTPLIQAELDLLAAALLGAPPAVSHRWSGCWGETPDRLPLAGRVPGRERLWVAAGYSGHGNVLGLACGEQVARAILGERPPELALFDPLRLFPARAAPSARRV